MKLTEEIIDLLIEEQLNERIATPKVDADLFLTKFRSPDGSVFKGNKNIQVKIDNLAANDGEPTGITVNDLVQAFTDKDEDELEAIKYLDQGLSGASGAPNQNKTQYQSDKQDAVRRVADTQGADLSGAGASKIKMRDIKQTIQNYDLSNAAMQSADPTLPPALKNLFDVIALSGNTLDQRIAKISEFSQNILKAAKNESEAKNALKQMGTLKFMQFAMAVDYLAAITKNMDSGSGAYLFETFLAALAGGNVAGKQKTAGGKSGGADFTFGQDAGDKRGSSKFVKNASKAYQKVTGFEKQETVHYVIAEKILDKGTDPDARESSEDVTQILGFKIYYPVLQVIVPKKAFRFLDVQGNQIGEIMFFDGVSGETIEFKEVLAQTKLAELRIARHKGDKFREIINTAVDNIGEGVNEAFDKFQKAFDNVNSAKESVGAYSVSGKQKDGVKAIGDLLEYKEALKQVFETLKTIGFADPTGDDKTATGFEAPSDQEIQKLSENLLDKMIQEVILTK